MRLVLSWEHWYARSWKLKVKSGSIKVSSKISINFNEDFTLGVQNCLHLLWQVHMHHPAQKKKTHPNPTFKIFVKLQWLPLFLSRQHSLWLAVLRVFRLATPPLLVIQDKLPECLLITFHILLSSGKVGFNWKPGYWGWSKKPLPGFRDDGKEPPACPHGWPSIWAVRLS